MTKAEQDFTATGFTPTGARYLVISRIGADSSHSSWLPLAEREGFDVLLSSYDRDIPALTGAGLFFEYRPGTKVAGYAEILRHHEALIRKYRYVALFDDDLETDPATVLHLFKIIDGHDFKIAQPALDHSSYFTYACLLQHDGFVFRHVNYVEMMCPFFRTDVLLGLAPVFDLGFESGIDLVWSSLAHCKPGDLAVIDRLPVHHRRPVGAIKSVNGFVGGRTYETDIHAILDRFGLPWLPALPFGGMLVSGRYTSSRIRIVLGAASLIRAIFIRSIGFRLRAIGKYFYRLMRAPARTAIATLPAAVPGRDAVPDSSSLTFKKYPDMNILRF